jgi:hypothetical protein
VLLAAALSACSGRGPERLGSRPPPAAQAQSARSRHALIDCLRHVGADAIDVSHDRDLHVSGGEVAVAFSTFDAYVGLASGPAEARQAARNLDQGLMLVGEPGLAAVRGNAVFYYDSSLVPAAAGRLVTACARDAEGRALTAMTNLSDRLPHVQFPSNLASAFAGTCLRLGTTAGCTCAYRRATRLYRYGQINDIADRLAGMRLAALIRMCARPRPSAHATA